MVSNKQQLQTGKKQYQPNTYHSESLGRNANRKKRSSTVPNFQEDNNIQATFLVNKSEGPCASDIGVNHNRKPPFSTFFQNQSNESTTMRNPFGTGAVQLTRNSSFVENLNNHQAALSRLNRSSSYQPSSHDHNNPIYASIDANASIHVSGNEDHKNSDRNHQKKTSNDVITNKMTIFSTQAGGINVRRGRSNLRPVSADVSLLTAEGRNMGKQEQSVSRTEGYCENIALLDI